MNKMCKGPKSTKTKRKSPTPSQGVAAVASMLDLILIIEEFEAFIPDRSLPYAAQHSNEVNEFLCQLDNCSEHGVFVKQSLQNHWPFCQCSNCRP